MERDKTSYNLYFELCHTVWTIFLDVEDQEGSLSVVPIFVGRKALNLTTFSVRACDAANGYYLAPVENGDRFFIRKEYAEIMEESVNGNEAWLSKNKSLGTGLSQ